MAEVTVQNFVDGAGVGPSKTLTTTAQLYTVPGDCDALVLTGTAAFSAAPNNVWAVVDGGAVGDVTAYLTTRATSAPYQLTIPRPLGVARHAPWPVIAWASSGSPVVDALVVRQGLS